MNATTLRVTFQAGATTPALTAGEVRMLSAYRKMDDEARGDILTFSESTAAAHPRRAANPFRLVGGTAVAATAVAAVPAKTRFTVAEFCAARNIDLPMGKLQTMGKACAKYSRELGLRIDRATDEMFGEVNVYCAQALEAVAAVMCPAKMEAA